MDLTGLPIITFELEQFSMIMYSLLVLEHCLNQYIRSMEGLSVWKIKAYNVFWVFLTGKFTLLGVLLIIGLNFAEDVFSLYQSLVGDYFLNKCMVSPM